MAALQPSLKHPAATTKLYRQNKNSSLCAGTYTEKELKQAMIVDEAVAKKKGKGPASKKCIGFAEDPYTQVKHTKLVTQPKNG